MVTFCTTIGWSRVVAQFFLLRCALIGTTQNTLSIRTPFPPLSINYAQWRQSHTFKFIDLILFRWYGNFVLWTQRIKARLWNDILPGHKLVLQSTSNLSEPSHAFPPLAPVVLMVLVLYFIPPPHVLEHWFQCSHSFHSQSTTIT